MKLEAVTGVEVRIDCDGATLQKHKGANDRRENQMTALSFIEALSGHNFQVTFRAESSHMERVLEDHVAFGVSLDGKAIPRRIYKLHRSRISYNECKGLKSDKNGQTVFQKFTFGDLLTVDEPLGSLQKKDIERLGEIQVDLVWARTVPDNRASRHKQNKTPMQANGTNPLPEKALKGRAISSRASLGEAKAIESAKNSKAGADDVPTSTIYPHGNVPFATYIFKYRSRKDLQIEGVIERSPDPEPSGDPDLENMSAEEMRNLISSMRAREKEVKLEKRKHSTVIKDETGDDDDDHEVAITASQPAKRLQQSFESVAEVEVLDLTDV